MALKGLDKVLRNLNKETKKIKNGSLKGLISAGIYIRRDMEKVSPKIPVDFGNMRSSWFLVTSKGGQREGLAPQFRGDDSGKLLTGHSEVVQNSKELVKGKEPGVALGFSAFYTWFVHEAIGKIFQRPGAGPKFFEASLKRNTKTVLSIIAKGAKIK